MDIDSVQKVPSTGTSPTWVVICGQVRDPSLLIEKIKELDHWRNDGALDGIIFSTWLDEIDQHRGLRTFLDTHGVKVVEAFEPRFTLDSHVFHQMLTLYRGLQLCPPQSIVLKLRTDKCKVLPVMKNKLANRALPRATPLPGWPRLFEHKIWVHSGLLMDPLFICDLFFIGARDDLLKLISFDISPDFFSMRVFAEQLFYYSAVHKALPIFSHFYRVNPQFVHPDAELVPALSGLLLESDFMLKTLATYYLVVLQYLDVKVMQLEPCDISEYKKILCSRSYSEFFNHRSTNFVPMLGTHHANHKLWFQHDYWVESLLTGDLLLDALGSRFVAAAEEMRQYSQQLQFSDSLVEIHPDARELAVNIERNFPSAAHCRASDLSPNVFGSWRIQGLVPR